MDNGEGILAMGFSKDETWRSQHCMTNFECTQHLGEQPTYCRHFNWPLKFATKLRCAPISYILIPRDRLDNFICTSEATSMRAQSGC